MAEMISFPRPVLGYMQGAHISALLSAVYARHHSNVTNPRKRGNNQRVALQRSSHEVPIRCSPSALRAQEINGNGRRTSHLSPFIFILCAGGRAAARAINGGVMKMIV